MKNIAIALLCLSMSNVAMAQYQRAEAVPKVELSSSVQMQTMSANSVAPKQAPNSITPISIGTKVILSEISLVDVVSQQTINLEEMKMKNGTLIMFSCNTCPFVLKAQPRTAEMMKYAKNNNIGFVIINSNEAQRMDVDSRDKMETYANENNYMYYFVDENSKIADLFGATKTPEVYLLNANNELVYTGAMDDNPSSPDEAKIYYLKDAMNALNDGKEIKTTTSKSVGCSIKRVKK